MEVWHKTGCVLCAQNCGLEALVDDNRMVKIRPDKANPRSRGKEFSQDPDRLLLVVDPRQSETAGLANLHLAVRPGTDALLAKAMIALILRKGWENKASGSVRLTKTIPWTASRPRRVR